MTAADAPGATAILDTHHAIVGSSGSGKTVTAKGEVEQLLRERRHVAILDPTDVWWGMRSNVAGDGPGFDLPIFGGAHGDVAIGPDDGDAIARIVIEQRVSAIVSLAHLHDGALQRCFMAAFVRALRAKPRGNFHLVVDEADEACPQTARDDVGFALTEDMIWVAKRGRVAGFVLTAITQRPADISKAVLSQMQTIVAHQLVDPRDQSAIDAYLKAKGDKTARAEVMASLPSLGKGERWIYSPALTLLERGVSPPLTTFDSSRTPEPGEIAVEPKMLAAIDVAVIAAAIEQSRIKTAVAAYDAGTAAGELLVEKDARIAALEGERAKLIERCSRLAAACRNGQMDFTDIKAKAEAAFDLLSFSLEEGRPTSTEAQGSAELSTAVDVREKPAVSSLDRGEASTADEMPPVTSGDPSTTSSALGAERRPLAVLARAAPAGLTEASWATLARFKRTGGTWSTYKSRLRTVGLIEQRGTLWYATPSGIAAIGDEVVTLPAPGPELVAHWAKRLPGAVRMLNLLQRRYPDFTARDALAADLGMAASGGTFGTYLSRLRTNGLLEEKGKRLRLTPALMERGA